MNYEIQTCVIEITEKCVNKCVGCFANKSPKEMSMETFSKILERLPVTKTVTISGGEPFMHPNLCEMVRKIKEKGSYAGIITSGAIFSEETMNGLKNNVDMLFVTIKYPNATDNYWKNNKKAFENALKLLEYCRDNKVPIGINWCVDKLNVKYFLPMVELSKKYGATLHLLRFLPYSEVFKKIFLDEKRWNKLCKIAMKYGCAISFPSKYDNYICHAGINRIGITVEGNVKPCLYIDHSVGNILNEEWSSIKNKLYKWRLERKDIKGCIVLGKKSKLNFIKKILFS